MNDILKKYDIDKMIEVVSDRTDDYSNIIEEYEEKYTGEREVNPDKCYDYGYGATLDSVISLLIELRDQAQNKGE